MSQTPLSRASSSQKKEAKLATLADVTLGAREFFRYGSLPFFSTGCIGLFVRVRTKEGYIFGRIRSADFNPAHHYEIQGRAFCLEFSIDVLPDAKLTATVVSSSPPTAEELKAYPFPLPDALSMEQAQHKFQTTVVHRPLTADDAQKVAALNEKLGKIPGNPVITMTLAEQSVLFHRSNKGGVLPIALEGAPAAGAASQGMGTPMGSAAGLMTQQSTFLGGSTQVFENGSGGLAVAVPPQIAVDEGVLKSEEKRFDMYVSGVVKEQEALVRRTERNREMNAVATATSEIIERSSESRKGKLQQETAFWETNDDKRSKLIEEYIVAEKEEKKKEGEKKKEERKEGAKGDAAISAPSSELTERLLRTKSSDPQPFNFSIGDLKQFSQPSSLGEDSQGITPKLTVSNSVAALRAKLTLRSPEPYIVGVKRSREDSCLNEDSQVPPARHATT